MPGMGKEKYYNDLCFVGLLGRSTISGRDPCISPSAENAKIEAEERMFCTYSAVGNREVNISRELQKHGPWLIIVRINI